jgi:hypothetical protein
MIAATTFLLVASASASAPFVPSCWAILNAVQVRGEIVWLLQCTASQWDEGRPVAALERCRSWLAACRRNPFSGGRPGIISF